jgi:hypothetical protein
MQHEKHKIDILSLKSNLYMFFMSYRQMNFSLMMICLGQNMLQQWTTYTSSYVDGYLRIC